MIFLKNQTAKWFTELQCFVSAPDDSWCMRRLGKTLRLTTLFYFPLFNRRSELRTQFSHAATRWGVDVGSECNWCTTLQAMFSCYLRNLIVCCAKNLQTAKEEVALRCRRMCGSPQKRVCQASEVTFNDFGLVLILKKKENCNVCSLKEAWVIPCSITFSLHFTTSHSSVSTENFHRFEVIMVSWCY